MMRNTPQPLDWVKAVYTVALWAVFFFVSLATAQAATINLAWDASTGATGYRVYQAETNETAVNLTTRHVTDASPVVKDLTGTTTTVSVAEGKTYYFAVKAYSSSSNSTSGFSNEVGKTVPAVAPAAPVPSLTYTLNPSTGQVPVTATFTGTWTGTATSAATKWSFSGTSPFVGSSGSTQPATAIQSYSTPGPYNVTFTVIGADGKNYDVTRTITVSEPATATPVPSLTYTLNPSTGQVPVTATFTGTWTGTATSAATKWSFSGTAPFVGSSGSTQPATAIQNYSTPGPYNVTFTVIGADGKNYAVTKTVTATTVAPTANFSASATQVTKGQSVQFNDTSTPTSAITGWCWRFVNPNSSSCDSTLEKPSYTYTNVGIYTVKLTASNSAGQDDETKTNFITVSEPSTSTGLVAAYNFEEASGATVVDASGKSYHGTISSASRITSGKFGRALSFDGVDDRVSLGRSLDFSVPFTAEAWIYPTSFADWRVILSKRDSFSPSDMRFDIGLANGTGALYVQDGTFNTSSYVPPLNTWTHIAVTIDANKAITIYVNGAFKQSLGTLSPRSDSTAEVMIGNTGDLDDPFQGRIDEIRVYNRALSATDIANEWKKAVEVTSPPKPLLGDEASQSVTGSTQRGIPVAFQTTASVTGMVTSLPVYLDKSSASTKLVAGLYTDNGGNPGTLLASGTLTSPKAGALNRVRLPATAVQAKTTYWVAILSPSGTLTYKAGSVARPSVTSTSSLTLPSPSWTRTISSASGGMPAYGAGY